jgi:Cu/Ag efflux protein CusF
MKSRPWLIALLSTFVTLQACARKEEAPAATGGRAAATPAAALEKTYPLSGKVVSVDAAGNQITVDHERIEGLWEPMKMDFEVRLREGGSLPPEGSTIRATLHVESGRYWLTDIAVE